MNELILNKNCLYVNKHIDANLFYKIHYINGNVVYYRAFSSDIGMNDEDFLFGNYKSVSSFKSDFKELNNEY